MNGKNILIGLSYIDRKYIEESEEDMRPCLLYTSPSPRDA